MQGATYTNPRPGQYLMHAHSHIKREVAATYSCLALIGAHQRDKAVRSMSGGHPRLKNPYRRGEGKAVYPGPASHNTRGTCWMGTAQQFYHDVCVITLKLIQYQVTSVTILDHTLS